MGQAGEISASVLLDELLEGGATGQRRRLLWQGVSREWMVSHWRMGGSGGSWAMELLGEPMKDGRALGLLH